MKGKKIVAGLAALAMLTAISAQAVLAAEGDITMTAEKVTAKAGADFSLKVDLGGAPADGISVCEFALTYDPAVVTITGVAAGEIVPSGVDDVENFDTAAFAYEIMEDGRITFTYSTAQDDAAYFITKDGTYATITGTVSADAKAGDSTEVAVTAISRPVSDGSADMNAEIKAGLIKADGTAVKYTVAAVNGSVTVVDDAGGESTEPSGDVTYGDVDVSGKVELKDVLELNKYLMLNAPVSEQGLKNADVDLSGKVDATDSLNILKSLVNIVTLPIE